MNLTVSVDMGQKKQDFSVSYSNLETFKAKIQQVSTEEDLAVKVTVTSARRGVIEQYAIFPQQETPAAA